MFPLKIQVKRVLGKGRGKELGFPTLNFSIPHSLEIPHGVYAGFLYINHRKFPVAIHFGPRPVFNEKDISLEAYVLGELNVEVTQGDLEFIKFIRDVENFPNPQKMTKQIEVDIKEIKYILKTF